jgi:hypothetical protein
MDKVILAAKIIARLEEYEKLRTKELHEITPKDLDFLKACGITWSEQC